MKLRVASWFCFSLYSNISIFPDIFIILNLSCIEFCHSFTFFFFSFLFFFLCLFNVFSSEINSAIRIQILTKLFTFHSALMPLGKAWTRLFSPQLWLNSCAIFRKATRLGEGKLWIQTSKFDLKLHLANRGEVG